MIKALMIILLLSPSVALSTPTEKELLYLEALNYRLNMMAVSNEMADSLALILTELRLIRCKMEPVTDDCRETAAQPNKEVK